MEEKRSDHLVDEAVSADILDNIAKLMATFHESDVALQNALSGLTARLDAPAAMKELQHIDLITQVHADLARMLPVLAQALRSQPTSRESLLSSLTLRSLQEALIDPRVDAEEAMAGELSLF